MCLFSVDKRDIAKFSKLYKEAKQRYVDPEVTPAMKSLFAEDHKDFVGMVRAMFNYI